MTIQYINTGSSANAGDGDSLRSAFIKVNNNFAYLSTATGNGGNGYAGSVGYTGSAGTSDGTGYTGSAGTSTGYTGSAGPGEVYNQSLNTTDDVIFRSVNSARTISAGGYPLDVNGQALLAFANTVTSTGSAALVVSNYISGQQAVINIRGWAQHNIGPALAGPNSSIVFEGAMGTPSLPGAVVNNQSIGSINFGGYNGNAWTNSLLNGGGYNPGAILMYASETWSGNATTSIYAGTGWFVRAQANGIQLNATSRQRYLHGFSTAGNRTDPPQHFLRIGTADNTAPTLINSNGIDTHIGHGKTFVEHINTLPIILGVTAFDYTTFTANFTGTTMTVTGISSGILSVGQRVYGDPTGLSSGTFIVSQTSGTTGSTGVYVISIAHPTGANSVVTTGGPDNETLWNSNSLIISGARKSGVSGRRNQLQVNDSLGAIYFYGQRANNSTGYGNLGGGIAFTALEKFTASANGTQAQIFTKNSGTLVSGVRLQLDNISNHYHSDNHVFFNSNNTEMVSMSTASVNVTAHMIPSADLTYDLGSTTTQWRSIYVGTGTIFIGGVALGVNQDNYVTVDGNPIITINTAGNLTIQGDVNIGTVTVSSTAPTATTGTQWFDTVEGRTYVATGGVWLDASPTQIPSPETYLDGLAIDGTVIGTANVNGDAIVIDGGDNTKLTVSNNNVTIQVPGSPTRPYWAAEFGGITTAVTTSSYTVGTGAFYDSVGNVYVLGAVMFGDGGFNDVDSLLLKYDTNGNLLWSRTWHDNSGNNCGAVNQAFAIDSNDRIYWLATDITGYGCWTGYMDTDGNLGLGGIAQGSLGFVGGYVSVVDIACDNSGNYYLAGRYSDGNGNDSPVVIKVDGDSGAPIWTGNIIPEDYEDLPTDGQYRAVTVNPATGDVWAIGDYTDNGGLYAMLSKWDINGTHQWTKKLVTQTGDLASAVIYNGGYVYTIVNDDGEQEAVVSKFDTDGDLIWASNLAVGALDPIPAGGPGSYNTGAYDLSFDTAGNVYVTGTIPSPPAGQPQLWITKLDPANGEMLYSRMLATNEGLVVSDINFAFGTGSGHRVGDIYQDKIVVTAVTESDINDSTSTNAQRVMVAQLPIDGSVAGTFDNINIVDITSDIDSICSTGTYTVTTLVWSTGTSTAIYSTSSISVSYVTDVVGLTGETIALGSSTSGSTTTNTWTFVNNNIILPPGGDILDSNGVSVLGVSSTTPLPSWITVVSGTEHLPTLNTDYGWDSEGAWTVNATTLLGNAPAPEGTSYPFRTTFSIPNDTKSVTTVDFTHNIAGESSSDFGIGVFAAGTDPVWAWDSTEGNNSANRIGAQYNGIVPELHGKSGGYESGYELPSPGTYRARLTVEPTGPGIADITLETLNTSGTVLDTITYEETSFFGTNYKIGFASDEDDGAPKVYFKNLTININNGATVYTDTLMNGNSVGGSTTALGDRLTAGSNSVVLSSTGTLTLPNGGVISEVGGAFGGAIRLEPSGASSSTQALVIYPTGSVDGNHIHLTAGGGGTDLYLGDDDQYVKVDHSGTIVVGTLGATTSTWTFGTDGVLTLSTASVILGNSTDPNVYIETLTTSTTNTWTFATDGSLTFPDATVQRTAYLTGQQTVHINTASTTTSIDLTELTGSIVMLYPEAGYTASGETHYVNLPFDTNSIALGTRITVLNYHPGNAIVSGWDGPGYTMSQFETIDLVYTFDPGYPGNIWWVTSSFVW